ncbi:LicD family protein [Parabacteroides sp. Y3-G-102]|jgi:2-C-methyl-D-erythritol 4-phosphate cytidylyltransferase|uniref:LicD family protein n=1 Tax=Parabacteroides TaxID=375288 RepID=UPI002030D0A6|nr:MULTISPECIES: LicD family protein [Parabacteroides]MCM0726941.1 LicD family protein [Parabacteroides sp. Y3-G-102]
MTDYNKLFPDNRQSGETTLRQAQLVMLRMFKIIDHICRQHNLKYWMCSGTLLGAIRHQGFIPWDDDLDICIIREDYEKFLTIAQTELPKDLFLQTRETDPFYDYLALPCKIRDKNSLIISNGIENKQYNMGLFIDIFPADRYHLNPTIFKKEQRHKSYFFYLCKGLDAELDKKNSTVKRFVSYLNPILRALTKRYLRQSRRYIHNNLYLGEQCLIGHGFDTPWRRYFNYNEIFPLKEYIFEGYTFLGPQNADAYLSQLYGKTYMTPPPPEKRIQQHAALLKPIL